MGQLAQHASYGATRHNWRLPKGVRKVKQQARRDHFQEVTDRIVEALEEGRKPWVRPWDKNACGGPQPGVNGVRFAAKTNHLYYTATAKKLFMRIPVDPETHDPAGEPELVVAGRMRDDFCIDEEAGVIYLTTHRQNTIDRVSMNPAENSGFTQSVAGDPFNEELIGPPSGAWSRLLGEYGKIAFFLSDGGTASPPPDGIVRPAKLLRVGLPGASAPHNNGGA